MSEFYEDFETDMHDNFDADNLQEIEEKELGKLDETTNTLTKTEDVLDVKIIDENIEDTDDKERSIVSIYMEFFKRFKTEIKDDLIRQSMNAMFEMNPKFRKDDSLILSVYNILKQYFIEYKQHVFLNAPTGSGKTIIAFGVNYCFTYVSNKLVEIAFDYIKRPETIEQHGYVLGTILNDYKGIINIIETDYINVISNESGVMGYVEIIPNEKPRFISKIEKNLGDFYSPDFSFDNDNKLANTTYLLTSSKLLQEQLDNDINNIFDLSYYYAMLKGSSNYECTLGTLENKVYTNFTERSCINMNKYEKMSLSCLETCPYYVARDIASNSQTAVLNYHYFLNVHRRPNMFFGKRTLTISDEGHLLPDIVTNIFNVELTMYVLNRLLEVLDLCNFNYNCISDNNFKQSVQYLGKCYQYFTQKLYGDNEIIFKGLLIYIDNLHNAVLQFDKYIENNNLKENPIYMGIISKKYAKFCETYASMLLGDFTMKMANNLDDLNYESNQNDFNLNLHKYEWFTHENGLNSNSASFNHTFRNLNESVMVHDNFIKKTEFTLHLSATFVDMENHASTSVGIEDDTYKNLNLPQQFDYKKSPIYFTKSGYLNYNNFDNNINDVMLDVLKITNNLHPNEKGIIHTASIRINNILIEHVNNLPKEQKQRFLFYTNSQEKEQAIMLMYSTNFPYIICGYSLYEGLDLKGDLGRFNILIKVPYGGQSDYTKAKMKRYPNWYENDTIQKVQQAIGRTDRSKDDYSTTYLLDSMFDKFRLKLPSYIRERIITKSI